MADKRISELDKATVLIDTDKFLIEQDNQAKVAEALMFRRYAEKAGRDAAGELQRGYTGEEGDTGNGIATVKRTSGSGAPGTVDTYTMTFTDGTKTTYKVTNGADGINGKAIFNITVPKEGWTEKTYIQTITLDVEGLLATDTFLIDIDISNSSNYSVYSTWLEEWCGLLEASCTTNGKLDLKWDKSNVPTSDIRANIIALR